MKKGKLTISWTLHLPMLLFLGAVVSTPSTSVSEDGAAATPPSENKEKRSLPPVPKVLFDNLYPRLNMARVDPARAKATVDEWRRLTDEELIKRVRKEAEGVKSLSRRLPCETTAVALAARWHSQKDHDAARRSVLMMTELAAALEEKSRATLDFFNSGVAITPCVAAYAMTADAPVWDKLPGRSGSEAETLVRIWLERSMLVLVAELEKAGGLHNMNPHAIQRGTGTALALNRPDLMRQWVLVTDRMCDSNLFAVDGMYSDQSTSYQEQVINHLRWAMANFEAFRDPPGYRDLKYGLKLDGTFKVADRWPVFENARKLAYERLRWPDGRRIGLGDTHMWSRPPQLPPDQWLKRGRLELWSFGMFSLLGGKGMNRTEIVMNAKPNAIGIPYSWGHAHGDSLALNVWAAGGEQLPDGGYPAYSLGFSSGTSYFHRNVRQHNSVFAWDTSTSCRRFAGEWMRSSCLAYDDGQESAGAVQLLHLSSPGPTRQGIKRRDRMVLLIAAGDGNYYFADIAALRGGNRHESYLLQPEDEACTLDAGVQLKPADGAALLDILRPKNYPQFEAYDFGHYCMWLDCYREPKLADGNAPFDFSSVGKDTAARTRFFLNPVPGSQLLFTRAPQLRRRIIENRKLPWDHYRGWHLTRSTAVTSEQTTLYAMVCESTAANGKPAVESVSWLELADAAQGQALALQVTGKNSVDLIYAGSDQASRQAGGYRFSGHAVVLRLDRKSKEPRWAYVFGPGGIRDAKGNAIFVNPTPEWTAGLAKGERKVAGDDANALLVWGELPPESIRGRWVTAFFGDGSGFGLKVRDFAPETVQVGKRKHAGARLTLEMDPGFTGGGESVLGVKMPGGTKTVRFRKPAFKQFAAVAQEE